MRLKNYLTLFKAEGEVIASWGQARLVKYLDGRYELRGGSANDHTDAKQWISMFMHEVVVRRFNPGGRSTEPSGIKRSA